ncbi:MAG: DUF4124 domain-containing protein [Gammaproteobacteria bacterium]|nr:MAG: DUF4124 domain-containing protein [Gammaproteobacteria bacterium]
MFEQRFAPHTQRVSERWWLVPVAALVMMTAVAGESPVVYRWTDADGVVHFSDQPPPDQSAQVVEPDPARLNRMPPPAHRTSPYRPPQPRKRHRKSRENKDARRCQTVLERIDTLNARMRAGYNAKQGERMRDQLREYKKDRLKWCMGRGK